MRTSDEKLAELLENRAQEYTALSNIQSYKLEDLAVNSQFHEQIMEDGYIFNPYIHRRWLPVQYKKYNHIISSELLKRKMDINYINNFIVSEINKLYTVSLYDPSAYEERRQFFTLDVCKEYLLNYCTAFKASVSATNYGVYVGNEFRYIGIGAYNKRVITLKEVNGSVVEGMVYTDQFINEHIHEYEERIRNADTYGELRIAIKKFRYGDKKLEKSYSPTIIVPDSFYEAFWKSGAYYSIKHNLMFERKIVNGKSGAEGCAYLRELLNNGASAAQLHAIYVDMERGE